MKKNKIVKLANKLKKILKHEKGFRLSGKHLFLTYSQINIDRMKALEQLKEKLEPRKVIKYILSTENHKDSGKHLHVYCELDYRCNIASKSRLDILDEDNKPVHGNYQSCRSYKAVIGYVLKEGKDQALTNMDLDDNGREFNPWKKLYDMLEKNDIKEITDLMGVMYPKLVITDFIKIKKNLMELKRELKENKLDTYKSSEYNVPEGIKEWMDGGFKKKSLYLSGKTGTGKTAMMNTLLSEKYGKEAVLRINNIQGLKKLNDKPYKALLMDDVDLTGLTGEDLISLFDTEHDSEQRVLYGTAEIPGGLPRAVISNKKLESLFKCKELSQIEAILRRCLNLDLGDKKLILRLEIEVTQNKTDSPDSESLNKC